MGRGKKTEINNKDRHLCKSCMYRASDSMRALSNAPRCFFILVEGHRRGCSAAECNKYVKGKRAFKA